LINKYLRFAISVVCMWVLVFGGFKLMTASGDEKKMSEANKILTWALIGIVIALLSYALVRIVTNLLA
jgi:FtsH-binding integral membrane protein